MKKYGKQVKTIAKILATTTLITSMSIPALAANYTDVKSDDWYYTTVTSLSIKGVISGYTDGSFKPNATITAGEFIKLVVTAMGYTDIKPAADGYWADTFISKAKELGLVKEGDEIDYTQPIDREHMALIIARALPNENASAFTFTEYVNGYSSSFEKEVNDKIASIWDSNNIRGFKNTYYKLKSGEIIPSVVKDLSSLINYAGYYFQDWETTSYEGKCGQISDHNIMIHGVTYKEQFNKVLGLGIMSGYEDKTLRPLGNATRAEASSMVARMIDPSLRPTPNFEPLTGTEGDYYNILQGAPKVDSYKDDVDINTGDIKTKLDSIGYNGAIYIHNIPGSYPVIQIIDEDADMTIKCNSDSRLNYNHLSYQGYPVTMSTKTNGSPTMLYLAHTNPDTVLTIKNGTCLNYTITIEKNGKSVSFDYDLILVDDITTGDY